MRDLHDFNYSAKELTNREDHPSFVAQTHSTRSVHERNHRSTEDHLSVRCGTLTALGDLSGSNVMLKYIITQKSFMIKC
jgi:hypothetical protein